FLAQQYVMAGLYRHAPDLGAAAEGFAEHIREVADTGGGTWHSRKIEARNAACIGNMNFDFLAIELTAPESFATCVAGCFRSIVAHQSVDDTVFRIEMCLCFHILAPRHLYHCKARLDQIANDLINVAADISDFGEFGRLNLDKRRIGELRQSPGNLGLADAS